MMKKIIIPFLLLLILILLPFPVQAADPPGATWTEREPTGLWHDIAVSDDGGMQIAVDNGGKIFTSIDSGDNWTQQQSPTSYSLEGVAMPGAAPTQSPYRIAVANNAPIGANGVYFSNNSGVSWTPLNTLRLGTRNLWSGVAVSRSSDSSFNGKYITAVVSGGNIYTSSGYGGTSGLPNAELWTSRQPPAPYNRELEWNGIAMSSDGVHQTAIRNGPNGRQIHTSGDHGESWPGVGLTSCDGGQCNKNWTGIAMSRDGQRQTAVASLSGIYRSLDYGRSWSLVGNTSLISWNGIDMSWDGKYQTAVSYNAGGVSGRIYTSSDFGATWIARGLDIGYKTVAMSADGQHQTVGAVSGHLYIADVYYDLTVGVDPPNTGTTDHDGVTSHISGEVVPISITRTTSGWAFTHWSGDCTDELVPCRVTMNRDRSVTAHFEPIRLDVEVIGLGTVTSDPPGINCTSVGGVCSQTYDLPTPVSLIATPHQPSVPTPTDRWWTFAGWSGNCGSGGCMVNRIKNATATFITGDILPDEPPDNPPGTPPVCDDNPFSPDGTTRNDNYRHGCSPPVNVSNVSQNKTGGLSVGSPSLGGLIVDAGALIRGVLKLPYDVTGTLDVGDVGDVLTLTNLDGTASWRPLALSCENKWATILPTATAPWQTATTPVCEAGYKVTGGGINLSSNPALLTSVYTESYKSPSAEAWVGRLRGDGLGATVYARCCKFQ
jgi:hypothetical protein